MNWSEEQIESVWRKASPMQGNDPAHWRKDRCGAWIDRKQYGNRQSQYGWEIDHMNPNGGDGFANLQPLHWENNAAKSDGPHTCAVTASGVNNVRAGQSVTR